MKFTFIKFTNISLFSHLLKSYPHRNINFNKKAPKPKIDEVRDISDIPKLEFNFGEDGESSIIDYWNALRRICAISPTGLSRGRARHLPPPPATSRLD